MPRVLETILVGRNMLSPVLATAARDVTTFNSTVSGANAKAAAGAQASAVAQKAAATSAAASTTSGAATQSAAASKIAASNVRASTSAQASAAAQTRAHASAAQSATLASRTQMAANNALASSNGMLGASLTPLTAGLGAVGLGLGYAAYRGMEFDAAMSQVQAASQASAGEMAKLRDSAITLGADTQYSAEEAAQGITEMSKAGVATADILGGGLAGALNLAAAGQMEVADAAEIGATALNVFNLEGNQMGKVADLLAAGAGKAQGSVYDLGMALNQSALVANATGLTIEETAGSLALFASQGLIGSDAGTSFRSMLLKLQNPSKESAGYMADLGLSMYDANGEFVGMEALAGQLSTRLANLTQEQRDAAMAQMFGSDAVRAANVLYEAGAEGVARWTANVNDSGYAAKQAADLNDNLRGDLEKLGGAFDSVMTSIGSGAQGPLREVVQMLTTLVNVGGDVIGFWNSLPGPVQIAVAAVGAFVWLKGPVGSALETIALRAMYAKDAVGTLGGAAATARTSVANLAKAAAPLAGIAILGAAVSSIIEFSQAGDEARASIDQVNRSLRDMGDNSARVDAISSAIIDARTQMREYGEVIENYESQGWFDRNLWYVPFGGEKTEVEDARQSLEAYEEQLQKLEDANLRAERSTYVLGQRFGMTSDEVMTLANKYGIDLTGSLSESRRLFENFYSMDLGYKPTEATIALKNATEDAATAIDEAKKAVDGYKLSLDILSGNQVSMLQVEAAFQDALSQSKDAMDDLGGAVLDTSGQLNLQSANGREAADVLLGVRDSGNQLIAQMIQQGATTDEVREKDRQLRESFIRSADQMGISRAAAEVLADQILGIPAERETTITAETAAANAAIAATQRGIDNMRGRDIEINVRAAGRFIVNPQGGLQEFADGGWTGPGSKYTPAGIVHADEFVVPKDRVNALGGPSRVGALVGMPGYADGGPVLPLNITQSTLALESTMAEVAQAMKDAIPKAGVAGTGAAAGAGVQRWLPMVISSLNMVGQPASLAQTVLRRMNQESGGNPTIVNRWDSNWAKGTPSVGLMQVIGPTYRANKDPRRDVGPYLYGTSVDPLSNTLAAHNYALRRYGSLSAAYNKKGGYDQGGLAIDAGYLPKQTVLPERVLSPRQTEAFERWMTTAPAAMPGYGAVGRAVGVGQIIDYKKLGEAVAAALPPAIGNVTFPPSDKTAAAAAIGDLMHEIRVLGRGGAYPGRRP